MKQPSLYPQEHPTVTGHCDGAGQEMGGSRDKEEKDSDTGEAPIASSTGKSTKKDSK